MRLGFFLKRVLAAGAGVVDLNQKVRRRRYCTAAASQLTESGKARSSASGTTFWTPSGTTDVPVA